MLGVAGAFIVRNRSVDREHKMEKLNRFVLRKIICFIKISFINLLKYKNLKYNNLLINQCNVSNYL